MNVVAEDGADVVRKKCRKLRTWITSAKKVAVYTGAGISTAASIPDYRGPRGVWTLTKRGSPIQSCNPLMADPTKCHMALLELYRRGHVSHILSQNCDGLHLRSGLPQSALSEVHGNMYIEVCPSCEPFRQFIRPYDVTVKTRFRRHRTGNTCPQCASPLLDTIVHFGEVGRFEWPLNWAGTMDVLDGCDLVICIGSSLQILKKYKFLWFNDLLPKKRPKLVIINLQSTAKDRAANLKIRARSDDVMETLLLLMDIPLPVYCRDCDPVLAPRRRNSKNNVALMNSLTECTCGYAASVNESLLEKKRRGVPRGSDRNSCGREAKIFTRDTDRMDEDDLPLSQLLKPVQNASSEIVSAKVVSFDASPDFLAADRCSGSGRRSDDDDRPPIPRMRIKFVSKKPHSSALTDSDSDPTFPGWWRRGAFVPKRKGRGRWRHRPRRKGA